MSPDGRHGATTSFVTGHPYSDGSLSTGTVLIDIAIGKRLANLEDFEVVRDGKPDSARDTTTWTATVTTTATGSGVVGSAAQVTAAEPDPDGSRNATTARTSVS